ncbi:MAG TPA: xanthine dehydrogenase family protein subunit M [Rhizobiales bacterium]|nr:xanthine dehydrogenase family protein subunit M [Hyphomicrobiales bacterium]
MRYERPGQLEQALTLLAHDDWKVLAGGTDFYPALGDRQPTGNILDITAIENLTGITCNDDYWRIGARTTWSQIIDADLPPAFDCLKLAAREVGSIQIQNRATLAGNICNASPAADGVPPLLTLDAEVEISSATQTRQIPLKDFIRGNRDTDLQGSELVSAVLVPRSSATGTSSFSKLGSRKYLVISIVMVAVRLASNESDEITTAAVSVGSCSAVAKRLGELENALIGKSIYEDLGNVIQPAHLAQLSPLDDVRAPATYRLEAVAELLARTINNARGQG